MFAHCHVCMYMRTSEAVRLYMQRAELVGAEPVRAELVMVDASMLRPALSNMYNVSI